MPSLVVCRYTAANIMTFPPPEGGTNEGLPTSRHASNCGVFFTLLPSSAISYTSRPANIVAASKLCIVRAFLHADD